MSDRPIEPDERSDGAEEAAVVPPSAASPPPQPVVAGPPPAPVPAAPWQTPGGAPPPAPAWPPAAPAAPVPAYPIPARRRGMGPIARLVLVLLGIVVVAVVVVGIGIATGAIPPRVLLNLVGLGPASVEIDNFRDDRVSAELVQLGGDEAASEADLNPFDIKMVRAANAGRYRLTVTAENGSPVVECTFNARGGDRYQFVLLPEDTVVNRNDDVPASGSELLADRSSLCRASP